MSLKQITNNKDVWDDFLEYINARIEEKRQKLERSNSIEEIYRCQGSVTELKRLTKLKEEVNGRNNR